ncbi:MAG: hypothetical protein ACRBG0_15980, partial [Lewinella sp.]|uniref:hypothetical protein n=1 Tax=Lewinella sp. TaxID=2004506 RepID=UPI003D6C0131
LGWRSGNGWVPSQGDLESGLVYMVDIQCVVWFFCESYRGFFFRYVALTSTVYLVVWIRVTVQNSEQKGSIKVHLSGLA